MFYFVLVLTSLFNLVSKMNIKGIQTFIKFVTLKNPLYKHPLAKMVEEEKT